MAILGVILFWVLVGSVLAGALVLGVAVLAAMVVGTDGEDEDEGRTWECEQMADEIGRHEARRPQ